MFDPDLYRKTCSESMKLSDETLEEMIFMTENKKRGLRKPVQIALTAAALAVVMCVTAAAANPEAVEKLWHHVTMSTSILDDSGRIIKTFDPVILPEVTVEEIDGAVILTVDGEETDITDVLARDGQYVAEWSLEDTKGTITVRADLTWEAIGTAPDGTTACQAYYGEPDSVQTDPDGKAATYTFTDDETKTDATYLPPEE